MSMTPLWSAVCHRFRRNLANSADLDQFVTVFLESGPIITNNSARLAFFKPGLHAQQKAGPPVTALKSVGYEWLKQKLGVDPMPHFCESYIASKGGRKTEVRDGFHVEYYPKSYQPDETLPAQLEFALKYEGLHLELIRACLAAWPVDELAAYVREKPIAQNRRRIWFLYETFQDATLDVENLTKGGYIDLLDSKRYFTTEGNRSRRHRVVVNWLGTREYCPLVRRTPELMAFVEKQLSERMHEQILAYPQDVMQRAMQYLYTKETKSSFAIERQTPTQQRSARFIDLLKQAGRECSFVDARLTTLQNAIVDERYAEQRFRTIQNYVGETAFVGKEIVHFVPPKPEDVESLMHGLEQCFQQLRNSDVDPVISAAVLSFGFVFIHPFEDGNGRIHRFLIHDYLADQQFTPPGVMFPISAAMLNNMVEYDATLEAFSRPLMSRIQYRLTSEGELETQSETLDYYRFQDLTAQATQLYSFLDRTIETEFVAELTFLQNYDKARDAMRDVVDMPDGDVDKFIRFVTQNHGKLSAAKRKRFFEKLTDEEVEQLEECVREAFELAA